MALESGQRLGPYEIVELLGKGGMGEVYRARDPRLDRDVAVKILPSELSHDPTFRRRFAREGKTISQLQHPNICTLHDIGSENGIDYLVMEFLDGETLEDRLRRGPLPTKEVLRIGGEIAEAIAAAHRRGVVHRDLKPGNVMLKRSVTKVVDFGLAKGFKLAGPTIDTQLPTMTQPETAEGTIVGTLHYMAPEQLEGADVDARADVWALGCILYETATGVRPFSGTSNASLIGRILKEEPQSLRSRQPLAPRRLDWLVGRCLEKDPERRWHSARDVSIELEALRSLRAGDEAEQPRIAATKRRRAMGWVASILATAVLTWLAVELLDRRATAHEPAPHSELRIRQLTGRPSSDTVQTAALSQDGEQLAFATREGLFLQLVATGEERLLSLPEELRIMEVDWLGPTNLLFSASTSDGLGLYKTSIFGGTARKLTDGAWRASVSPDGSRIAYLEGVPSRTVTVAGPDHEDPRNVLDLGGAGSVWEIAWSPDGRSLLVGIWSSGALDRYNTVLEVVDLESGTRKRVLADPRLFQNWRGFLPFFWTAADRLVVGRREPIPNENTANLWLVPMDRSTAAVEGDLVRLTQFTGTNPKDLSATADGLQLAFLQERSQSDVLVAQLKDGGRRLGETLRVTVDQRQDSPLGWSPDGQGLVFMTDRTGVWSLFRTAPDGGRVEFLAEMGDDTHFMEISREQGTVYYWRGSELARVPMAGGPSETLLEAGVAAGIGCNVAGDRCLIGERSADELTYVFSDFDFVTGRGDEVLRIDDRPPFTNWDLSPDGSRLVVGHNDDRLRIFDLPSGKETVLTHEGLSYGEFPAWSADGRGIFVDGGHLRRGRLRKGLLYISLDDGEAHVLREHWDEWDTHPVPSTDGQRLAFSANVFYDANAWMIEGF